MKSPTTASSYVTAEQFVADFIQNDDLVDLFITNAPFMSLTQMTKLFKCYDYMILAVANTLKIPINAAYAEIPLGCIISRLEVLSPNAIIKHVSKGTLVILPKDNKFVRIVHHFSAGRPDSRTATESKISDLSPHLQTLVWSPLIDD